MQIRTIDAAEWPALAAQFDDLTFEQTAEYAVPAARRIGGTARFLSFEEDGQPVAAAALRLRTLPGLGRGIAWCPSGPLLLPGNASVPNTERLGAILRALRTKITEREGHVLRLRFSGLTFLPSELVAQAAHAAGFCRYSEARPYRSVVIDLSLGEEELKRRLDGKWRTDLRFALKSDLQLQQGCDASLQTRFMKLFQETQQQKGFRPDIPPEFHFLLDGSGYRVDTLITTRDGQDLAGIVVGFTPASATYLFGATALAGRPLRAGYFLQWAAIDLARARGCHWYDLGGINEAENPDVSRFKTRMNGTQTEAEVWQAMPRGILAPMILGLERVRAQMKRRQT